MATDTYVPMIREEDEIEELAKINEDFKSAELIERLRTIEKLGKELEVGGQTSYQNTRKTQTKQFRSHGLLGDA